MMLLTLFALSPVFPVVATSVPLSTSPSAAPTPAATNVLTTPTRHFQVLPSTPRTNDVGTRSRGPGVVVVFTKRSKDRAYALMNRLNELGLVIMGYEEEDFATYRLRVFEARVAVDSCSKRNDVRSEEVGIVTFDEASEILPDITRDSTLGFAVAISTGISLERMEQRFLKTRAATLLVQGVTSSKSAQIPSSSGSRNAMPKNGMSEVPPQTASLQNSTLQNAVFHNISRTYNDTGLVGSPVATDFMTPNVSFWTASRTDVSIIGEAKSRLGAMVMTWIQEQVHTTPINQAREVRISN